MTISDDHTRKTRDTATMIGRPQSFPAPANSQWDHHANHSAESGLTLLNHASDAMMLLQHDANIIFANSKAGQFFNIQPQKLIGRNVTDLISLTPPTEALSTVLAELKALPPKHYTIRNRPAAASTETSIVSQPGVDMTLSPVDWAGGSAILAVIPLDVNQPSFDLDQNAKIERLRDFAEASQDWFWEMDRDYRFTFVSDQVTRALALLPEQLIGKKFFDLNSVNPDDPEWRIHVKQVEAQRPFRDVTFAARVPGTIPEHQIARLSISGKPIYDQAGTFAGYRGSCTTITARWDAAETLRQARDQAEIASRLKTEFLASMSHELRTPLNSIIGFADVIRNQRMGDIDIPAYVGYGEDIHASGRHLLSLIDDLMDLSRIEAGALELIEEEVDMPKALCACSRMIEGRAKASNISLLLSLPETVPLLLADAVRIRQIIINLLTNAVKYTDPGGTVEIRTGVAQDGALFLEVEDNGIGIPENELPRLLEPFHRVESRTAQQREGSGLGLTIVKSFVDAHDAKLCIDSTQNEGTCVRVEFPIARTRTTHVKTRSEKETFNNVVTFKKRRSS